MKLWLNCSKVEGCASLCQVSKKLWCSVVVLFFIIFWSQWIWKITKKTRLLLVCSAKSLAFPIISLPFETNIYIYIIYSYIYIYIIYIYYIYIYIYIYDTCIFIMYLKFLLAENLIVWLGLPSQSSAFVRGGLECSLDWLFPPSGKWRFIGIPY